MLGPKRIETRSWSTKYRGLVAIHAAKGFPPGCRELVYQQPFRGALDPTGKLEARRIVDLLPVGQIIGVCEIVDCVDTTTIERDVSKYSPNTFELTFGDYSAGRFGFVTVRPRPLAKAVPCRGMLGIWTVPAEVEKLITF